MTKNKVNLHLVGQWTLIVFGLIALLVRLEHRLTTLEVLQKGTDNRVVRVEEKMDKMLDMALITDSTKRQNEP